MTHTRALLTALLTLAPLALLGCDPDALTPDAGTLADLGTLRDGDVLGPRADGGPPGDSGPLDPPEGPLLNSVFPNRASIEGGVPLRLVGRDFVDGVEVFLGQLPCDDVTFDNENRVTCVSPAVETATTVDVTVRWPDGRRGVITDGFTWFVPLTVRAVDPERGPALGGSPVVLRGTGFVEASEVRIGGIRATITDRDDNGTRLTVTLPPGEPGLADVAVRNLNGTVTLRDAFTWYEELFVDDIQPRYASVTGGVEVRLAGIGLLADSAVDFGGASASVIASEIDRQRLRVTVPPGEPGVVDLDVTNTNGQWTGPRAFLYVADQDGPFALDGVVPDRVSTRGGEDILIGGNAFDDDTTVYIDGTPAPCVVERAQLLRCTAPPHAEGPVDLTLERPGEPGPETLELPGALTYYEAIEILDLVPARGSVAGGTLVELVGEGFTDRMQITFDGARATILDVAPTGDLAIIRTPPGRRGFVSVRGRAVDDETLLPLAYEYFDPTIGVGGIDGDEIGNAVNVSVLDARTGAPVPDAAVVVIGLGPRDRWEGITDETGRVTIADPALVLPVSVTAAAVDYSTATYDRVTAQNTTLLLNSLIPPMPGNGVPPPPIPPVLLRGDVTGINILEKPNEEGYMLVAIVETSHRSPGNRLGSPPPAPLGILVEDGPYTLETRPGELAVIVTAGYVQTAVKEQYDRGEVGYWTFRDRVQPIAMGLRRFISGIPGDIIDDLDVVIDRPTRMSVQARIQNPPGGGRGAPDSYSIKPILDLGAEGYFDFRFDQTGPDPRMRFSDLPDLSAWPDADVTMLWEAEANQTDPTLPYAYSFAETEARDMRDGVTIGPIVGTTATIEPVSGGNIGAFRWAEFVVHAGIDGPSEPADFHQIRLTRGGQVVWTHLIPGAVHRFQFPVLPQPPMGAAFSDLDGDELQMSILSVIVGGAFDFGDFTYNDFGRIRSYAWSYSNFFP